MTSPLRLTDDQVRVLMQVAHKWAGPDKADSRSDDLENTLRMVRVAAAPTQEPRQWQGLTDAEIEQGREQTFSINNPFCPCDQKTMLKAARWAEAKLREKNAALKGTT